jgi:hypothetical protein
MDDLGGRKIYKKKIILIGAIILILSCLPLLFNFFSKKGNITPTIGETKVATQKDSEDIDEVLKRITSSNFEEELKIALQQHNYDAVLAGYSIYSDENKFVLLQLNNTNGNENIKSEIKQLVDEISNNNSLGSFKIELSYKKE